MIKTIEVAGWTNGQLDEKTNEQLIEKPTGLLVLFLHLFKTKINLNQLPIFSRICGETGDGSQRQLELEKKV